MSAELEKNYFELFGLPEHFELDTANLNERYRDLQREFHPDRLAGAADRDRRLGMQMAAQINAGFNTLKSPLSRGRYLLELKGLATQDETDTAMAPAFLMEQMELRESLAEARQASDPLVALAALSNTVSRDMRARIDQLPGLFADGGPEALEQARQRLREMQFLDKLEQEIRSLEDELL